MSRRYAGVDLGASSGRVMVGTVGPGTLDLAEVRRFANEPIRLPDGLHWDLPRLYREVLAGLVEAGPVVSSGVDSWGVDYGLLDADGGLLGLPYHYRDARTATVGATVDRAALYAVAGTQHLPFNTVYQLLAETPERLNAARSLLQIPDLIAYWLTGRVGAERTNASTTSLYDVRTGQWADEVLGTLGIPRRLFADLRDPGDVIGAPLAYTGLSAPLVSVGSHDTASAVLAVPAKTDRFAYVSAGTWSLVGVELEAPVLTEESRAANFTNEVGVDGTVRYLRNVMGLWLLQECQRVWADPDTAGLIRAADAAPPFGAVVNPDSFEFGAPGDMPVRIAEFCGRTGQTPPLGRAAVVRTILESLALAHRAAVRDAVRLSGRAVDVVHVVGGGANSRLLCQLTADACGLPVIAGPVEATALGNILIQASVDGGPMDRASMRELVAATQSLDTYQPQGDLARWDAAAALIGRG